MIFDYFSEKIQISRNDHEIKITLVKSENVSNIKNPNEFQD
jgi:hypothetical protein